MHMEYHVIIGFRFFYTRFRHFFLTPFCKLDGRTMVPLSSLYIILALVFASITDLTPVHVLSFVCDNHFDGVQCNDLILVF